MAVERSVFSKVIDGDLPGRLVWSDDVAVAMLTIAPVTDGHTLVVPREPVEQFTDADDALLAHLAAVARTVGAAQRQAWSAPRAAVVVAGFEVAHLHLHVLPAWSEADTHLDRARTDASAQELDAAADRLRAALRSAGHADRVPS